MEALQLESGPETRDSIMERLTAESVAFKALNQRVKRTGGLDAELNLQKRDCLWVIDGLLDKLNVVDLEAIPVAGGDDEITTGGWEHEPLDGRGQE